MAEIHGRLVSPSYQLIRHQNDVGLDRNLREMKPIVNTSSPTTRVPKHNKRYEVVRQIEVVRENRRL
jgi:hypothetical protein